MKAFLLVIFNVNYFILARAFILYFRIIKRPSFDYQRPYESVHKMNIYIAKERFVLLALILVALYFNRLILKYCRDKKVLTIKSRHVIFDL